MIRREKKSATSNRQDLDERAMGLGERMRRWKEKMIYSPGEGQAFIDFISFENYKNTTFLLRQQIKAQVTKSSKQALKRTLSKSLSKHKHCTASVSRIMLLNFVKLENLATLKDDSVQLACGT